jgi:hypothetical protein
MDVVHADAVAPSLLGPVRSTATGGNVDLEQRKNRTLQRDELVMDAAIKTK